MAVVPGARPTPWEQTLEQFLCRAVTGYRRVVDATCINLERILPLQSSRRRPPTGTRDMLLMSGPGLTRSKDPACVHTAAGHTESIQHTD